MAGSARPGAVLKSSPMRQAGVLLVLVLCGTGCRATYAPTAVPDAGRICELEGRVARLEEESKGADLDHEILALEVERAGLLVTYAPDHPAILRIDRKIETLQGSRAEETGKRHARMLRQLESQRAQAIVTYTSAHPVVRRLDAQIAFLRSDEG